MTDRNAYIAGLRQLADVLENHPEVPLPHEGNAGTINFFFLFGEDSKADMAAAARAFPGTLTKKPWSQGTDYFSLRGQLAGVKIQLTAYRDQVCERVVTGTREIEVTEPDPEQLAKVPTVTRTEVVEEVEWRCTPLLAPAETVAGVA